MSADAGDAGTAPGTAPATGEGTGGADEGGAELLEGMLGTGDAQGQGGDDDVAAQLAHWKEMARKNEKRARENQTAATRLKEIERANLSELEKAQAAQRDAEQQRDEALASHARVMAAAANNLPVELIEHLGTGTDEEINERAELFASIIESTAQEIAEQLIADQIQSGQLIAGNNGGGRNGNAPQTLSGNRPVESLRAGSAPAGGTPTTNEQWFRNLLNNS